MLQICTITERNKPREAYRTARRINEGMPRGVSEACWLRAQKTPAESRSKRRCRSRQAAFLIVNVRATAGLAGAGHQRTL
jgi:hypothetical protein